MEEERLGDRRARRGVVREGRGVVRGRAGGREEGCGVEGEFLWLGGVEGSQAVGPST